MPLQAQSPDQIYSEIMSGSTSGAGGGGGKTGRTPAVDPDAVYAEITGGKSKPHGASGSYKELGLAERGLRTIAEPIARFGEGAVEMGYQALHMPLDIVRSAGRPAETESERAVQAAGGGLGLLTKRLVYDPSAQSARDVRRTWNEPTAKPIRKAVDLATQAMGTVPIVGPVARSIAEKATGGNIAGALGSLATLYLGPKAVSETTALFRKTGKTIGPLKPTRAQVNNLSNLIETGVRRGAPQPTAMEIQPFMKQSMQEAGLTASDVAVKAVSKDPLGDLYRGASSETKLKIATLRLGQKWNPTRPTPLPVLLAEHAVQIADRPTRHVMTALKDEFVLESQAKISSKLRSLSDSVKNSDPPLAAAYMDRALEVEAADGTVQSIDGLKIKANKETQNLFKLTGSAEAAATARPVWSYRQLGDLIREHMYPELEQKGTYRLIEHGRLESSMIQARDGFLNSWAKAAKNQVPAELEGYLEYVTKGHSETFRFALSERSASTVGMLSRLKGRPFPLADFNRSFRDGIGETRGFQIDDWYRPGKAPKKPEQLDLLPIGQVGNGPLLEPPPGTSKDIGESIFKVQQRADQAARRAPPPTLSGTQKILPERPFFPGKSGKQLETIRDPVTGETQIVERDYTNQNQLFSEQLGAKGTYPTPKQEYVHDLRKRRLWSQASKGQVSGSTTGLRIGKLPKGQMDLITTERQGGAMAPPDVFGIHQSKWNAAHADRYSMPDLREMLSDIQGFIDKNKVTLRSGERQELVRKTVEIRQEISKRAKSEAGRSKWRD